MDNSNKNCGNEGDTTSTVYYGVHIPPDMQVQDNDGYINVFQYRTEALSVVKKYKKARFKAFNYYHEALDFAVHGLDYPNNNSSLDGGVYNKNAENQVMGEKPCLFRGPKSQDLVKLRKGIETGDLNFVRNTVWDNPRYLISSGDTPSILQEGFRYNALHVAAKSKNAHMCDLILSTVSNINFIKLLYGDDMHQNADDRSRILVDLYLNTPDKGLNETPLHFAVKFGAADCVEVFTSYPQCDRYFKNKHGKIPSMIICDRCDASVPAATKHRIAALLEDSYYVPVLRTEDNSLPAVIGEPFSPTSPPNLNRNPISPRLEIHAYAGPMDKENAEKFRKIWKVTPRNLKFSSPSRDNKEIDSVASLTFKDPEKGLERLGKNLANKHKVGWKEYWPFLDSFVDISSDEGLKLLEEYLEQMNAIYSPVKFFREDFSSNEDVSCGKNNLSSMSELCKAFQNWNLNDSSKSLGFEGDWYKKVHKASENSKQELGPYLCIEKSCQVFAHRISNDILHLLETDYNSDANNVLENQIRHLEVLVASFMSDDRFSEVNFQKIHSRLGQVISSRVKDNLTLAEDTNFVCKNIESWLSNCTRVPDYLSSDDESMNYRNSGLHAKKLPVNNNSHLACLLDWILFSMWTSDAVEMDVATEEDCVNLWNKMKSCCCFWQKVMKRGSSVSRNNSLKRLKDGFLSKKLIFDDDDVQIETKANGLETSLDNNLEDDCSSDEEFYTPPASPSCLLSSDDEEFNDTQLPDSDVFLEGNYPTKIDSAVFNALKYGECILTHTQFPNIYKWYHSVSLFSEQERQSWSSPAHAKCKVDSPAVTSTPTRAERVPSCVFTPPRSWFRITQENSPRAVFSPRRRNLSSNL